MFFSEIKDKMHLYLAGNNKLLTDQRLVDQDCEALYRLLQNNVFITSLDLRYNNITDEGAKWIAKLLEVCFLTLCPLFYDTFPKLSVLNMSRDMRFSTMSHCGMCDQESPRSACAYVQSDQSLC